MKNGIHTSEFWLSLGALIASVFVATGNTGAADTVEVVAGAVAGIVPIVYAALRTLLKRDSGNA